MAVLNNVHDAADFTIELKETKSSYLRSIESSSFKRTLIESRNGAKNGQSDYDRQWLRRDKRKSIKSINGELRCADLFSGCGGMSLGVQEACDSLGLSFKPVLAWDILNSAINVYEDNFGIKPRSNPIEETIDGDIGKPLTKNETELLEKIGQVDIVVGGPPCQGNSDLNNHSRRNDPRNELYMRATRFIEITKPQFAIIENVVAVRRAKEDVINRTAVHLKSIGYQCEQFTIRGLDVGVPQTRVRHFTLAWKGQITTLDALKTRNNLHRTLKWAIEDLPLNPNSEEIFHSTANSIQINKDRMQYLLDHALYDLPNDQRPPCHQNGHTYPAVYGRLYWSKPTPTITTGFGSNGQGRFQHPLRARTLTPHEAARVQTFPDFFKFSKATGRRELQILIGNAVPPLMAYHIAIRLISGKLITQ